MRPPIFHPQDNQRVAIVDGRDIHLLNLDEERKLVRLYGHPAVIVCTAFGPDGSRFYSIDRQGGLAVCNISSGEQLLFIPAAASNGRPVVAMAISPDGKTIALADDDDVRLIEVGTVTEPMAAERSVNEQAAQLVDRCYEQTRLTSRALEMIRNEEQLSPEVREEGKGVCH